MLTWKQSIAAERVEAFHANQPQSPIYSGVGMGIRICVTGSRHGKDRDLVNSRLDALHAEHTITRLGHGAATGYDTLCKEWAESRGVETQPYPYLRQYGKAGGPMRNRQMLETERPDMLVWFPPTPGSNGTEGCKKTATSLGIPLFPKEEEGGAA